MIKLSRSIFYPPFGATFPTVACFFNNSIFRWTSTQFSEEHIFDALSAKEPSRYARVIDISKTKSNEKNSVHGPQFHKKPKEVVINCKNIRLNHYRNQRYDKFSTIPLASKGWKHNLSKGDHFTIKISDDDEFVENLFWDNEQSDFSKFKLNPYLIEALKQVKITKPTKIQALAIPSMLSGRNCLVTAETGCGKTLAYIIPLMEQILELKKSLPMEREPNAPIGLVIVPSRDLANQIGDLVVEMSYSVPLRCHILTGGRTKNKMLNPEFNQVDLQIATLGALSKLVTVGIYNLSQVRHIILDEGDSLLDDSFNDLLVRFLKKLRIRYGPNVSIPNTTQLSIVSATMPTSIYKTLEDIVEPESLENVTTGKIHRILPHVPQTFYRLGSSQKPEKLLQLLNQSEHAKESVIIFSNKTKTSDWISLMLNENGKRVLHLNAAMPEIMRRNRFQQFQKGEYSVLCCTDIASRGLDTVHVHHVINYDFPGFMADYIHRCGRTGRVGSPNKCKVSNFISTPWQIELVNKIETAVRTMDSLPNVNANISKIINYRNLKKIGSLI